MSVVIPEVPEKLIRELERLVPERCPDLKQSDREIWFYAGKRELVRLLASWHQAMIENRMKG